jgi:hypothetical protein
MFQLTADELGAARMGLRRPPYSFTEHGVAMLSAVLKSERARNTPAPRSSTPLSWSL